MIFWPTSLGCLKILDDIVIVIANAILLRKTMEKTHMAYLPSPRLHSHDAAISKAEAMVTPADGPSWGVWLPVFWLMDLMIDKWAVIKSLVIYISSWNPGWLIGILI